MPGGTQKKKYEREIAEILERMERDEPRSERVRRQARYTLWQRWRDWQRRIRGLRGINRQFGSAAGWIWMGLTVGTGILGLILGSIVPILGIVCAIAMVVIFFSPLLGQLGGPADPAPSQTWRGRNVVDYKPRGGLLASLRYHWRRFRYGRGPRSRF